MFIALMCIVLCCFIHHCQSLGEDEYLFLKDFNTYVSI